MSYALINDKKHPLKAAVLSDAVYHSYLGEYFFGQTDFISFGGGYNGWGGLINPSDSKVNLFLNAYTITNFINIPITAEGWLSSTLPGRSKVSPYFAAGNQAILPHPIPEVKIKSANLVLDKPKGGTYTFVRRVEPNETLTKHDFQGMYIIPPGSSFVLYLLSPRTEMACARIAFGWWEEKVIQGTL